RRTARKRQRCGARDQRTDRDEPVRHDARSVRHTRAPAGGERPAARLDGRRRPRRLGRPDRTRLSRDRRGLLRGLYRAAAGARSVAHHTARAARFGRGGLMAPQYDVAIIGGGIAGCAAAAYLAATLRVIVLEREAQPGYHATGRSAATFSQIYGSDAI